MEEEPCGKEVEHCVSGSGIHETMLPKRENSRAEVSGMRARERNNSTQHSTAQHSTASSTPDDVRFPREVNSKEGMGETAEGARRHPAPLRAFGGGIPDDVHTMYPFRDWNPHARYMDAQWVRGD